LEGELDTFLEGELDTLNYTSVRFDHGEANPMKQLVALEATVQRVDGDDFATLSGRVAFQKRIYLAQVAGIHLGYGFSWNQHGPYSSELALDRVRLEAMRGDIQRSLEKLSLRGEAEKVLDEVKTLIQRPAGSNLDDVEWLELLSSLHYLAIEQGGLPLRNEERQGLEQDLVARKPHLNKGQDQFTETWKRLESLIALN